MPAGNPQLWEIWSLSPSEWLTLPTTTLCVIIHTDGGHFDLLYFNERNEPAIYHNVRRITLLQVGRFVYAHPRTLGDPRAFLEGFQAGSLLENHQPGVVSEYITEGPEDPTTFIFDPDSVMDAAVAILDFVGKAPILRKPSPVEQPPAPTQWDLLLGGDADDEG